MERGKEEIAFKDFKSSVTVGEFEAVLEMAKEEYKSMKKAFDVKKNFLNKCEKDLKEMQSIEDKMPLKLKEKLKEGFQRRAEKEFKNTFNLQLDRHRSLVDFINRFNTEEEDFAYLD